MKRSIKTSVNRGGWPACPLSKNDLYTLLGILLPGILTATAYATELQRKGAATHRSVILNLTRKKSTKKRPLQKPQIAQMISVPKAGLPTATSSERKVIAVITSRDARMRWQWSQLHAPKSSPSSDSAPAVGNKSHARPVRKEPLRSSITDEITIQHAAPIYLLAVTDGDGSGDDGGGDPPPSAPVGAGTGDGNVTGDSTIPPVTPPTGGNTPLADATPPATPLVPPRRQCRLAITDLPVGRGIDQLTAALTAWDHYVYAQAVNPAATDVAATRNAMAAAWRGTPPASGTPASQKPGAPDYLSMAALESSPRVCNQDVPPPVDWCVRVAALDLEAGATYEFVQTAIDASLFEHTTLGPVSPTDPKLSSWYQYSCVKKDNLSCAWATDDHSNVAKMATLPVAGGTGMSQPSAGNCHFVTVPAPTATGSTPAPGARATHVFFGEITCNRGPEVRAKQRMNVGCTFDVTATPSESCPSATDCLNQGATSMGPAGEQIQTPGLRALPQSDGAKTGSANGN